MSPARISAGSSAGAACTPSNAASRPNSSCSETAVPLADVVDLARHAAHQQRGVRFGDIAHVEIVAPGFQASGPHRRITPGACFAQPLDEGGHHEIGGLARAGVRKWPRDDAAQPRTPRDFARRFLGTELARGIGRHRCDRVVLAAGPRRRDTVYLAAGDDQHQRVGGAGRTAARHDVEQARRSRRVHLPRQARIASRRTPRGQCGEMHHRVTRPRHQGRHRLDRAQFERQPAGT